MKKLAFQLKAFFKKNDKENLSCKVKRHNDLSKEKLINLLKNLIIAIENGEVK